MDSGKNRRFRKNVVEKEWAVLCRNEYGEEWVEIVAAESEYTAMGKIVSGVEVVAVEEYNSPEKK